MRSEKENKALDICCRLREAGDGLKSQGQISRSGFGDFSTAAEVASRLDDIVFHGFEPLTPGCHDFRRWPFKAVVQQHKFLHSSLPVAGGSKTRGSPVDSRRAPGYVTVDVPRLRSAKSNNCGSLRTSAAEPMTLARFVLANALRQSPGRQVQAARDRRG